MSKRRHVRLDATSFPRVRLIDTLRALDDVESLHSSNTRDVDDAEAQALADVLRTSKHIETLTFVCSNINGMKLRMLARALKENSSLKSLSLWRNNIEDSPSLGEFGLAVAGHPALAQLDLAHNSIRRIPRLASRQLLRLDVSSNNIEEAATVATVLSYAPNLVSLNLSRNRLRDHKQIKILAAAIEKHECLRDLRLSGNKFGDDGMAEIAPSLGRLYRADLASCDLTNLMSTADRTDSNAAVRTLDLGGNRLGDMLGIGTLLQKMTRLCVLNLASTHANVTSAERVADAIKNHPTLHTLDFGDNNPTNAGAARILWAATRRESDVAFNLTLSSCKLSTQGAADFEISFRTAKRPLMLDLNYNHRIDDTTLADAIDTAAKSRSLVSLSFSATKPLSTAFAYAIARLIDAEPRFTSLYIQSSFPMNVSWSDVVIQATARHSNVAHLTLSCHAREATVANLVSNCRALRSLAFDTVVRETPDMRALRRAVWTNALIDEHFDLGAEAREALADSRTPDVLAFLCFASLHDAQTEIGPAAAKLRERDGNLRLTRLIAECMF
jgi:Leucine-rich repeat (LRR) protein